MKNVTILNSNERKAIKGGGIPIWDDQKPLDILIWDGGNPPTKPAFGRESVDVC